MRKIGGRTILERVSARLEPQCDGLILNANGDPARFAAFGLPVMADTVADFPGPLAGILAAARLGGGKPARGVVGAERRSGLLVPAARPCLAATSGAQTRKRNSR
jgi:molybdopterin-guanine dinucleotide biosynthesis protein A